MRGVCLFGAAFVRVCMTVVTLSGIESMALAIGLRGALIPEAGRSKRGGP